MSDYLNPGENVHCREFHELAMDYRAASFSTAGRAYNALTAYIDKRASDDAARYRWLRDKHNSGDDQWFIYGAGDNLDVSINAAIHASQSDEAKP